MIRWTNFEAILHDISNVFKSSKQVAKEFAFSEKEVFWMI